MKRSRGRIRYQRMRLAWERAERNLTEPTGIDTSVAPVTHPLHKLFPGRDDILVYSHPTVATLYEQRHPGSDAHWKIPVGEWPRVLHRIDQGEPLRKVAGDYKVSYEAIRRVLRATRQTKQAR